jgi:DNA-binding NarL/FixJ family response regulator
VSWPFDQVRGALAAHDLAHGPDDGQRRLKRHRPDADAVSDLLDVWTVLDPCLFPRVIGRATFVANCTYVWGDGGDMSEDLERTAVALDRQPLWLDALEEALRPLAIEFVAKSTTVADALDALATYEPTLFLADFDVDEQQGGGLDCVRTASSLVPATKIIVLSGRSNVELVESALSAGAIAYVVKTAHAGDIVAAVRQIFTHSIFFRSSGSGHAPVPVPLTAAEPGLTRREFEILRLVSEGYSNAQLARMLWVTEQTVKFHLSNIYRKLDVVNRTEASRWAQVHGVLSPETQSA